MFYIIKKKKPWRRMKGKLRIRRVLLVALAFESLPVMSALHSVQWLQIKKEVHTRFEISESPNEFLVHLYQTFGIELSKTRHTISIYRKKETVEPISQ